MSSKILGFHTLDFLTALFAVALIIPIWATYRYDIYDPTQDNAATTSSVFIKADPRLASFIQAWNNGLAYFFLGYALTVKTYVAYAGSREKATMYRWLVLLVSLVAWGFTLARPIGGANNSANTSPDAGAINQNGGAQNDQLDSVAKNVFGPLAASSLFALPITYFVN